MLEPHSYLASKRQTTLLFFSLSLLLAASSSAAFSQGAKEGREDYYSKWLNQDVVYIITPEEKSVFQSLTSHEEREHFIEQFWKRRDSDPRTAVNEFKEEHYRRIAYANERFQSGFSGWQTDRGRIYIMFGPPDEREAHPAGGPYERPFYEGGGRTNTYPFEVWRYRYIPGVGQGVEIEFVDSSLSGEYRIALTPDEKDALLRVANAGLTIGEQAGSESRLDRIRGRFASNRENPLFDFRRAQDMPFARFRQYADLQKPPQIQFKDLQQVVETNISYQQLTIRGEAHWFRISEDIALVPITLEVPNKELTYIEKSGVYEGTVNVYGRVQSLSGELVAEFEETLISEYGAHDFSSHNRERSAFQKMLLLPPGVYKVTLVCKDVNGDKIGNIVRRLAIPQPSKQPPDIAFSSLILSRQIQIIDEVPDRFEPFVLGDVKVVPKLGQTFYAGDPLYVYFHLYNVPLDQAAQNPLLDLSFSLVRDDSQEKVLEITGSTPASIFRFSEERVVVIRPFDLTGLPPGRYRLEIKAHNPVTDRAVTTNAEFTLAELPKEFAAETANPR